MPLHLPGIFAFLQEARKWRFDCTIILWYLYWGYQPQNPQKLPKIWNCGCGFYASNWPLWKLNNNRAFCQNFTKFRFKSWNFIEYFAKFNKKLANYCILINIFNISVRIWKFWLERFQLIAGILLLFYFSAVVDGGKGGWSRDIGRVRWGWRFGRSGGWGLPGRSGVGVGVEGW